jgi:hypothetical protein
VSDKKPSFQFYPGDWMKDPAVRQCSLAARGLWIDMLFLMFESSRRGYLQQANGTPTLPEQLSRMTGCDRDEAAHLLQELENAGVFSRTENGTIYSRRMARDERISSVRREAGKSGAATRSRDDAGHFAPANSPANVQQTHQQKSRSSSSTSSSSSKPSGEPGEGTLHVRCRSAIHAYWQKFHPGDELAPWDGFVGKRLATFLSANPRLTEAGFRRLLDFRAESEVNHSEPPADWIPKLIKFGSGPLDRFGKPITAAKSPSAQTLKFVDMAATQ